MTIPYRILLVSAQEDFEFPLAEAARKQIFALALRLRENRHRVQILIVTPNRSEDTMQEGIPVKLVTKASLLFTGRFCRSFDAVHYLGTIGYVALMVAILFRSKPRTFTATDGGVFSTGSRVWLRRLLARWFHRCYDRFQTYTSHQRSLLVACSPKYERKLVAIAPILHEPTFQPIFETKQPRLLYLGHLSYFKGVDIVMEVFHRLAREMPQLQLTIACNGLTYQDDLGAEVRAMAAAYPGRVVLRGIVNVYDELQQAGLLMYPLRSHSGTFAVPLSLCESLACRTPFLSTLMAGTAEYFDDYFLCRRDDVDGFVDKARDMLVAPQTCQEHIEQNLRRIGELCRQYEFSN